MTTPRAAKGRPVQPISSERGYGVPVDTDEVSSTLESARLLRLALNVLWDGLPNDMTTGPVGDALESIHNRINVTGSFATDEQQKTTSQIILIS